MCALARSSPWRLAKASLWSCPPWIAARASSRPWRCAKRALSRCPSPESSDPLGCAKRALCMYPSTGPRSWKGGACGGRGGCAKPLVPTRYGPRRERCSGGGSVCRGGPSGSGPCGSGPCGSGCPRASAISPPSSRSSMATCERSRSSNSRTCALMRDSSRSSTTASGPAGTATPRGRRPAPPPPDALEGAMARTLGGRGSSPAA
mmetsp:Transcript_111305/g.355107  ORF Transcript_111305/g.355107 Transcript_111305/m.355107 type:complete len:205 (-) Transcript_111305:3-617(-)